MSKLLSLFSRGGGGNSSTEAIRQSTTMTMAYLLEQNRKFEFFMRQKVERLEQLVSSQQQTRAEFEDEEFEEDLAEPETGEDTNNNGAPESQPTSKPPLAILVEDEPLTADTKPSPKVVTPPAPEAASSSPGEEEGDSDEGDMSAFGVSSSKSAGSTAEEADSEPLSWESYLGASAEEPTPTENDLADEQAVTGDEEAEINEHIEALTELSGQPDLQWMVDGLARSPAASEEEVAETYTTDMAEDTDGAVELGLVTVEDGKIVIEGEESQKVGDPVTASDDSPEPLREGEGEPDHNHETVAGSGLQGEQPSKVTRSFRFPVLSPVVEPGPQGEQPSRAERDDFAQGSEELKEERGNSRTTPTPVINKPSPVVVKSRETSLPPVRITAQTLGGEEEEEEVEALLPSWLKNKLDKKVK